MIEQVGHATSKNGEQYQASKSKSEDGNGLPEASNGKEAKLTLNELIAASIVVVAVMKKGRV